MTDRLRIGGDAVITEDDATGDVLVGVDSVDTERLHTKEYPVKNVLEYGAVGDGVTDDAQAIQGAIDARSGRGIVFFPDDGSEYLIDSTPLLPTDDCHFYTPVYRGATLTAGDLGSKAIVGETGHRADRVSFRNIGFDGSSGWSQTSYDSGQKAIFLQKGEDIVVDRCYMADTAATALGVDHYQRQWYSRNHIVNAGTDGQTAGSNGIGIGVGTGPDSDGPVKARLSIVGNVVENSSQWDITIEQLAGNVHRSHWVAGNHCRGGRGGIEIEIVEGAKVVGNSCEFNDEWGIRWADETTNKAGKYGVCVGNSVIWASSLGPDTAAIQIDDPWDYLRFAANTIEGGSVVNNSTNTNLWWDGVRMGGPLGGADLSSITGNRDGEKVQSDGTATGFPAYAEGRWDSANTQWVRVDGQATV